MLLTSTHKLRLALYLYVFIASISISFAQGPNKGFDFPPVTAQELQAASHSKDTNAVAAVLIHYGESRFNSEMEMVHREKYRIKVYKTDGLKYGDVEIFLYDEKGSTARENAVNIVGNTYVLQDGKVKRIPMDIKTSVFEERYNEYASINKFSLPRVEVGAIIEYEYELKIPAVGRIRDWDFQEKGIPTDWSEYVLKVVPFYEYVMESRGVKDFAIKTQKLNPSERTFGQVTYKEMDFRWALKDVPAFKEEKYATSPNDYRSKMHFQLAKITYPDGRVKQYMESWPSLIDDVYAYEGFRRNFGNKQGKEEVEQIIAGISDPIEKAEKLYTAVAQNYEFNGYYGRYPDPDIKDLVDEKSGNNSSLCVLLSNWLNMAGIESYPVWLSTRKHGKVNLQYPFSDAFNYNLTYAKIGEKEFLMDPTDKWRPFGLLPYYSMNGLGLIMNKKGEPRWVRLDQKFADRRKYNVTIRPDTENGGFVAELQATMLSYAAYQERRAYQKNPSQYEEAFEFIDNKPLDFTVQNADSLNMPFIVRCTYKLPIEELGNLIYMSYPALFEDFMENPFKSETRTFPIDYGLRQDITHRLTFTIPEGYDLEDKPQDISMILSDKTVAFNRKSQLGQSGNFIQVYSRFQVGKTEISPDQYTELRKIYTQMYDSFQEALVLKKVNN